MIARVKSLEGLAPKILTQPPGPKARIVLEREKKYVSDSHTKSYAFVADHGEGCFIWDVDGNCYLDFAAGIAVNVLGHNHAAVNEAVAAQMQKVVHYSAADFYTENYGILCERLAKKAPGESPKKVFLTNSGTEAVECAIKLARYHTSRFHLIAFLGCFHGRTLGSLSLTSSRAVQRQGFGPMLGGVTHIPYPNSYRQKDLDSLDFLENVLFQRMVPPSDVAAIIFEPIQGEGGYLVMPPEDVKRLRKICDKHGILLIADEVQSGMGRTGKFLCMEHYGVEPDITTLAKGIANGLPLGACIARGHVMDWTAGAHTSTFGGNPVACAASLAVLDQLEAGVQDNAARMGKWMTEKLRALAEKRRLIGDVRGKGLMIAVEMVRDRKTKEPASTERDKLLQMCFERGLLLIACGFTGFRIVPPLVIGEREAQMGIDILDEVLSKLEV
jgi:4-aminobutyrate aminotransferase